MEIRITFGDVRKTLVGCLGGCMAMFAEEEVD